MVFESARGDRRTRDDLLFKTIDGNDISLDVIMAYRLDMGVKSLAAGGKKAPN